MLVCHCFVIYERQVREAIAAGARGEMEIACALRAGTGCGGCLQTVRAMLALYEGQQECITAGVKATEPS